jgi:hypothetical protein
VEGNPHPLRDGKVENGEAEAVPALPGDHPMEEVVLRVAGDRIIRVFFLAEDRTVQGGDDLSRALVIPHDGGDAASQTSDLLLDEDAVRRTPR